MNFMVTKQSQCARALIVMASLCLILNCHKPPPQLGSNDALVTNANTDNSNSNQNAEHAKAEKPTPEQPTKANGREPRPSASATPKLAEFARSQEDELKDAVTPGNANQQPERQTAVEEERVFERRSSERRAITARPNRAASPQPRATP